MKRKSETARGHRAKKLIGQDSPVPSRYLYRPSEAPSTESEEEVLASSVKENVEPARICDAEPSDDGGGWTRVVRKGQSRSAELQEKFQKLEIKETPDLPLAARKDECRPLLTAREELKKLLEDPELTPYSRAEGERLLRDFSARANTRSFGREDDAPPNRYAVLRNLGEEARSGGEDMEINSGCDEEYASDLDNCDELYWESCFVKRSIISHSMQEALVTPAVILSRSRRVWEKEGDAGSVTIPSKRPEGMLKMSTGINAATNGARMKNWHTTRRPMSFLREQKPSTRRAHTTSSGN